MPLGDQLSEFLKIGNLSSRNKSIVTLDEIKKREPRKISQSPISSRQTILLQSSASNISLDLPRIKSPIKNPKRMDHFTDRNDTLGRLQARYRRIVSPKRSIVDLSKSVDKRFKRQSIQLQTIQLQKPEACLCSSNNLAMTSSRKSLI